MTGKNIKKISFSGQPYLQAGIEKNGQLITLPQLFNMYSALFYHGFIMSLSSRNMGTICIER